MAVVLGALHAAAGIFRESMNADGIAYLDIGDAFWRGDWQMAVNSVWSPLYAWIIALPIHLLTPTPDWEFRLVHCVNFAIYLCALICFDFFWGQVIRQSQAGMGFDTGIRVITFPSWLLWALGYGLFIWSSLNLIEIWAVTPDLCVAGLVYLAAAMLLRIRMSAFRLRNFALLGTILGFAYLAKAIMFPVGFAFIAAGLIASGNTRRAIPPALVAMVLFLAVSAPFIIALSEAKGRLTFGDAGKLTYAWFVDGVPYPHWQGGVPDSGMPQHPTRMIMKNPRLYEFGSPVKGTYPVSYDPSYWYEGLRVHFDWRGQTRALLSNFQYYFDLFIRRQGGMIGCLLLLMLTGSGNVRNGSLRASMALAGPAVAAFSLYALVYAENRYVAPFLVLLWAAALCRVRLLDSAASRKLLSCGGGVMLVFLAANIGAFNLEGLNALALRRVLGAPPVSNDLSLGAPQEIRQGAPSEIAAALRDNGLLPGDKIAFLGDCFDASWARLARLQIVAEIYPYDPDEFWQASPELRSQILRTFGSTQAEALISVHTNEPPAGWQRAGNTGFLIYRLKRQAGST